ncbi:hypothetical protein A8709_04615 [Paenibacillus pectinilyticus]|uniref:C1q domain-containing protein n=1 Tax=Paenibacillus pectinilyticus TaxID=512399 RepID=A0A1C0ZSC8_9BACL|nr:hypothetical protein [Paenibacillus pectinilyticus]OCT10990.1 hypothetical protein A8709_04615 [Paenibacillus pectinilyticus]
MSSNTTNVGLYKKNPSTDGNDTFDINTMLNDNWDRIDAQLGAQVAVSPPPTAVNLVNGLQVVNVPQSSPFNLQNIKGRTLVNLLGRDGNFEDISRWGAFQGTIALDTANKIYGANCVKATIGVGQSYVAVLQDLSLKIGSNYIAVAEVRNGNSSMGVNVAVVGKGTAPPNLTINSTLSYVKFVATVVSQRVQVMVNGVAGQYGYADGFRVYELSTAEYTALASMTDAQIAAKYPYVDDVKHVNAPYVIKYGENLAPTFGEWSNAIAEAFPTPYSAKIISSTTANQQAAATVNAVVGTAYTYAVSHNGYIGMDFRDNVGNVLLTSGFVTSQSITLTAPSGTATVSIYIASNGVIGTFTFSNPMLNLGVTAKPFKPRNDNMLAFPNVQLTSSVDGSMYDTLFKRNGKYFVEKRFRDMVLDGSQTWIFDADLTGCKSVRSPITGQTPHTQRVTKFDGKPLTFSAGGSTVPDWTVFDLANLYITIADLDSGWGEAYTPTAQEIQAYFYGWRMYDGGGSGLPYNNSGTKTWNTIAGWGTPTYSTFTLPTSIAPVGNGNWKPYKLAYQLATPVFEEILVEGSMSLHEGLNQIEVGQGAVIREKAYPWYLAGSNEYLINNTAGTPSLLRNRARNMMMVYKNGKIDNKWYVLSTGLPYGTSQAGIKAENFDPTAVYEASYIALDQYILSAPVQAVTAEAASNLKTVVDVLAANQADQDARISATEILARQIYNVPQKTSAVLVLYVDGTNGADNNDGSAGKPFKTIQRAINNVPQIVNHVVTINVLVGAYAEDVDLSGFICAGSTSVFIKLVAIGVVTVNSISMSRTTRASITGFTATATTNSGFSANNCGSIDFNMCTVTSASGSTEGFSIVQSKAQITNCVVSNRVVAFLISTNSEVMITNNTGTGNTYIFSGAGGSKVTTSGTIPTGTTIYSSSFVGVVNPWGDNTQANRSAFRTTLATTQNISASTSTKLAFASEFYDNLSEFDSVINYRFTAAQSGIYLLRASAEANATVPSGSSMYIIARVNGINLADIGMLHANNSTPPLVNGQIVLKLNVGDYVEFYYTSTVALTLNVYSTEASITRIA